MIFLDSSFLVAFAVDGDTNHEAAVKLMLEIASATYGPPVISDYVFDETMTVTFVRSRNIRKVRRVGDAMLKAFRVLKVDDSVFSAAWINFGDQKSMNLSFTDCTSAELMRQHGIRNIATYDGEFRKLGNLVVLGPL